MPEGGFDKIGKLEPCPALDTELVPVGRIFGEFPEAA